MLQAHVLRDEEGALSYIALGKLRPMKGKGLTLFVHHD